jgi:TolB-like protein
MSRLTHAATTLAIVSGLVAAPAHAQGLEQAVQELTDQLLASLTAAPDNKIAVIEFTDLSGQPLLAGRLIAEEITTAMFQGGRSGVRLVERSKLEEVIREQKRGTSGLLDSQDVQAFGKALGVDGVLTGTIATLTHSLRINTRLIAVPSAEVLGTASIYLNRDGIPESLLAPTSTSQASQADNGGANAPEAEPAIFKPRSQENKGITYELLRCYRNDRDIACDLLVTNNAADRELRVRGGDNYPTVLYDQRGHTFEPSVVRLADAESPYDVRKRVLADIPTELNFTFKGMPAAIEFIKVLSINTDDGRVEFRDVHFAPAP